MEARTIHIEFNPTGVPHNDESMEEALREAIQGIVASYTGIYHGDVSVGYTSGAITSYGPARYA